jgi:hypothetical protein
MAELRRLPMAVPSVGAKTAGEQRKSGRQLADFAPVSGLNTASYRWTALEVKCGPILAFWLVVNWENTTNRNTILMIRSSGEKIDKRDRELLCRLASERVQLSATVIYFSHVVAGVYDRG